MCMRREWLTLYQSVWLCVYTLPCGADIEIYMCFFRFGSGSTVLNTGYFVSSNFIQMTRHLHVHFKCIGSAAVHKFFESRIDASFHECIIKYTELFFWSPFCYPGCCLKIIIITIIIWTPYMHSFVPSCLLTDTVFPLVGHATVLCVVSEKYQSSLFSFCLPPAVITVGHPK